MQRANQRMCQRCLKLQNQVLLTVYHLEEICVVWQEEFNNNDIVVHLDCGVKSEKVVDVEDNLEHEYKHTFHSDCLKEWLKVKFTCPMCRKDLADLYKDQIQKTYNKSLNEAPENMYAEDIVEYMRQLDDIYDHLDRNSNQYSSSRSESSDRGENQDPLEESKESIINSNDIVDNNFLNNSELNIVHNDPVAIQFDSSLPRNDEQSHNSIMSGSNHQNPYRVSHNVVPPSDASSSSAQVQLRRMNSPTEV